MFHDRLTFALGSATAPRSLIWRAWSKDDEVHLAAERTTGPVHLIAYPTGRWRITVGTVVSRWHRPKEFRPGWVRGPDVVMPGIVVAGGEPGPADTEWLRAPGTGQAARVQLWFGNPFADEARWWSALPRTTEKVGVVALRRAGSLYLVRDDVTVDTDDNAEPADPNGRDVVIRADHTGRPSLYEMVVVAE